MKLQQEVRHKSKEVDDTVLLDAIRTIRRRVKIVSRDYDIPYIAGYSTDGHTVFIDRHLPKSFRWLTKTVHVDQFLLAHECVEKALPAMSGQSKRKRSCGCRTISISRLTGIRKISRCCGAWSAKSRQHSGVSSGAAISTG
jgi:hypothetical protein